jgi:Predicted ATPase of the PP-loop superfamily implicated in cell cycle control
VREHEADVVLREETEITLEELADLPEGARLLIDIRDETSMAYGTIPGAVHFPDLREQAEKGTLPADRTLVLFCMHGTQSLPLAEELREMGYPAVSLKNGYGAWLRKNLTPADRSAEIEDALRRVRRFHEKLMSPFTKAIRDYQLLQPGDRVAVCISGGKDSMLMAKLFQELQRHRKFPFELVFLVMDPGYNELNRLMIETNAAALGIPVTIFETKIFDIVDEIPQSPCYLCARMRRGHLYHKAQELGCNKIALGHHYDDVIETILMGMLWSGQFQTMMPKVHSKNFEGMELIRPMSLIRESDIMAWRDYHGLHFIQCACHFTDTCSSCREDGAPVSKRMETKQLIRKLHETNPDVEANLYNTARCVNLDKILGYKQRGAEHSFLDDY